MLNTKTLVCGRWLGANAKLTRLKLVGGVHKLLKMDLSWEQFDNLYRYLNPTANGKKGHLDLDEFMEAFGPPTLCSHKKRARPLSHNLKGVDAAGDWMDGGIVSLREMMDVACATLLDHGLSLQEVVWCFDRNGNQSVSVSEFVSMMKMLVGRAFSKQEVFFLMDSVDASLDRKLQTDELLEFFYLYLSDRLNRLNGKMLVDDSSKSPKLQKLRKNVKEFISKNFERDFRDGMKGRGLTGAFAPLLKSMGIVTIHDGEGGKVQKVLAATMPILSPLKKTKLTRLEKVR